MLELLTLAQTTAPTLIAAGATDPATLRLIAYALFILLVVGFLALDLGVFHRDAHEVTFKEATIWSIIWVTVGVSFSAFVFYAYENHWLGLGVNVPMYAESGIVTGTVAGWDAAKQYLTGYVVEKSLAMDNIFVIAMIFTFFAIPNKYQHRVLFWGIIGALVMRGAMIAVAGALIAQYMWILIIFGIFLLITALKMALVEGHSDPSKNIVVRWVKKFYPVTTEFHGQKFFVTLSGTRHITPLFLALIMVEITDLVFAVDSIPAIFAITPDPFIVFTSNIFAILGLRSLYFCLAALIAKFRFLKPALIIILAFVGVKLLLLSVPPYLDVIGMAAQKSIKIDTTISLAVVLVLLGGAVILSVLLPSKQKDPAGH
jgi:tellurite resistance protein TerC